MYKYRIYFDQFYLFYFLRDNFKGHPKTVQFVSCDPYNQAINIERYQILFSQSRKLIILHI